MHHKLVRKEFNLGLTPIFAIFGSICYESINVYAEENSSSFVLSSFPLH